MTTPNQTLRRYGIFGSLLTALFVLISAAYFLFHVNPQERNVTVAGVVVPVPDGMKKVSDARPDVGDDELEQVAFKGNISPSMIARFYHNLMPAKDWQPDAALGAKTGGYAFTRGSQQLMINIAEPEPETSVLTIVVNSRDTPEPIG